MTLRLEDMTDAGAAAAAAASLDDISFIVSGYYDDQQTHNNRDSGYFAAVSTSGIQSGPVSTTGYYSLLMFYLIM